MRFSIAPHTDVAELHVTRYYNTRNETKMTPGYACPETAVQVRVKKKNTDGLSSGPYRRRFSKYFIVIYYNVHCDHREPKRRSIET